MVNNDEIIQNDFRQLIEILNNLSIHEMRKIHKFVKPFYDVINSYDNSKIIHTIRHKNTDTSFTKLYESQPALIEKCSSIGELKCKLILHKLLPKYTFIKIRPGWLTSPNSQWKLELDLYNEELNVAIEFNGKQHYDFVPIFHKNETHFKQQQMRDEFKQKLCNERGVKLITISYRDNITDKLSEEINKIIDWFKNERNIDITTEIILPIINEKNIDVCMSNCITCTKKFKMNKCEMCSECDIKKKQENMREQKIQLKEEKRINNISLLSEYYNVPESTITSEFMKKYGSEDNKTEFFNTNCFLKHNLKSEDDVNKLNIPEDNKQQLVIGLKILNILSPDFYNRTTLDSIRYNRLEFKEKIKTTIVNIIDYQHLKPHNKNTLNQLYEWLKTDNFRAITQKFNRVMTTFTGIKLQSVNNRRCALKVFVYFSDAFKLREDNGVRYVTLL
jgi:hypothetical protein